MVKKQDKSNNKNQPINETDCKSEGTQVQFSPNCPKPPVLAQSPGNLCRQVSGGDLWVPTCPSSGATSPVLWGSSVECSHPTHGPSGWSFPQASSQRGRAKQAERS